jgi:hypothetical protein
VVYRVCRGQSRLKPSVMARCCGVQHCAPTPHLALKSARMREALMICRKPGWGRYSAGMMLVGLAFGLGCGKQEKKEAAQPPAPAATAVSTSSVAPLVFASHWIGKTRFSQDTNAAAQNEIWAMPESQALEQQTLDKLAKALPAILGIQNGDTNQLAETIRPLLEDVLQLESFTELRATTNQPAEFALAIKLSPERTAIWQTNLALLKAAGGAIQWSQTGEWTMVGFQGASHQPNAGTNGFFANLARRVEAVNVASTNWLELGADLSYLLRSNSILAADHLPMLRLAFSNEGQSVRTHGEMTFAKSLSIKSEPWQIPTNLIHDPLVSFTVARGIKPFVEASKLWRDMSNASAPNQFCMWALDRSPFQTYFAAAWPGASNNFWVLAEQAQVELTELISSNRWGQVDRMEGTNGIMWTGTPFFQPFLSYESNGPTETVIGGFVPILPGRPLPPELLAQFITQDDIVYYDWEITGGRVSGVLYLTQASRLVSMRPQLPSDSAAIKWIQAITPKLGNAATAVTMNDLGKLTVSRTSGVGLTCAELNGMMDWLESPTFPHGLHSFTAAIEKAFVNPPVAAPKSSTGP